MRLHHSTANSAIAAAHERATERNAPSAVAIVDAGGNLLAFSADVRAILAARELAIAKAYTSVALRADTEVLGESVQPGGPSYGIHNALPGRPLVTFAGGRPIFDPKNCEEVIGAVGVSGGSLDDDAEISRAAIQACQNTIPP